MSRRNSNRMIEVEVVPNRTARRAPVTAGRTNDAAKARLRAAARRQASARRKTAEDINDDFDFDSLDDEDKADDDDKTSRVARARRIALARRKANAKRRQAGPVDPAGRDKDAPATTDVEPDATIDVEVVNEGIDPNGRVETDVTPVTKGARRRKRSDAVDPAGRDQNAPATTDVDPDVTIDVTDTEGRSFSDDASEFVDSKPDDVLQLPKASSVQLARLASLHVAAGLETEASAYEAMAKWANLSSKEAEGQIDLLNKVADKSRVAHTADVPSITPSFGQRSASSRTRNDDEGSDILLGL